MQLYIYVAIFRLCMREREKEREPNAQNLTQGGRWSWVNQMVFTPAFIVLYAWRSCLNWTWRNQKSHIKEFDTNVDMNALSITIFLLEGLSHSLLSSVYPWGSSSDDSTSSSSDDSASSFIPSSSLSSSSSANRNNFP